MMFIYYFLAPEVTPLAEEDLTDQRRILLNCFAFFLYIIRTLGGKQAAYGNSEHATSLLIHLPPAL